MGAGPGPRPNWWPGRRPAPRSPNWRREYRFSCETVYQYLSRGRPMCKAWCGSAGTNTSRIPPPPRLRMPATHIYPPHLRSSPHAPGRQPGPSPVNPARERSPTMTTIHADGALEVIAHNPEPSKMT